MRFSDMNDTETHPWPPFIPDGAELLIMGTFPPKSTRWSMRFYYPNRINDFWRIMGLIFYGDKHHLWDDEARQFRLREIKQMLTEHHIAMNDTGAEVRRLRDNASDKFLEILRPVDLFSLLPQMPRLKAIATTGQKAAEVIASITGTEPPAMGRYVDWDSPQGPIRIYRMPSTSRAYPLSIDKKADFYAEMFRGIGIL